VKQSDDISAEDEKDVDVISRLIHYSAKPFVMMNQLKMIKLVLMRSRSEPVSQRKLVSGYQGTLVSLRLPRNGSAF
jgi:hypothetical protein